MDPHQDAERARARGQALRSAWTMAGAGALLLLATLAISDERWRVVALILGGLLAGVGVLTALWARIDDAVPPRRRP